MYVLSLTVHAILGVAVTAWILRSNRCAFASTRAGRLELAYWAVGFASVVLGWYFNIRFVLEYHHLGLNPLWGPGASWTEYVYLMFPNWAADSASQDYLFLNVLVLPLMSIAGALRHHIPKPWLFFIVSLFTSAAFGFVLYLIVADRRRRARTAARAT